MNAREMMEMFADQFNKSTATFTDQQMWNTKITVSEMTKYGRACRAGVRRFMERYEIGHVKGASKSDIRNTLSDTQWQYAVTVDSFEYYFDSAVQNKLAALGAFANMKKMLRETIAKYGYNFKTLSTVTLYFGVNRDFVTEKERVDHSITVPAYVCGGLAVHRSYPYEKPSPGVEPKPYRNSWTISHVASGRRVTDEFPTKEMATAAAVLLLRSEGTNWELSEEEIIRTDNTNYSKHCEAAREVKTFMRKHWMAIIEK